MDKADKFLKTLQDQVNFPLVEVRIASNREEGYSAECLPGRLILRAKDSVELIHALCQSHSFWKAGLIAEIGTEHIPLFPLRPYVLEKNALLESFFDESAPDLQNRLDILCESALAIGYNALWIADWQKGALPLTPALLSTLSKTAHEYGMQFGTAPHPDVEMEYVIHYCDELNKPLPRHINDKGMSKLDIVLASIENLVSTLNSKQKLVLFCPKQNLGQNFWEKLLSHLPPKCYVAFTCSGNEAFVDSCRTLIGRYKDILIPIISTGYVGGGFWPQIYLGGIEGVFSKPLLSLWHTVAISGAYFPVQSTLYHGLLWSLGQMLWRQGYTFSQWHKQWFKTYCAELDYEAFYKPLAKLTALSLEVKAFMHESGDLPYEEQKSFIEASLSQIKYLYSQPWPEEIQDGVSHCLIDLRRLLLHHLLQGQIAIPQIVDEKDLKGGFWTTMQGSVGQAVRSGVTIRLLESPQNVNFENVHWWKGSVFLN